MCTWAKAGVELTEGVMGTISGTEVGTGEGAVCSV